MRGALTQRGEASLDQRLPLAELRARGVSRLVGMTIDGKYQIERELGRGGMGTVYLATHVGTERPVAVKIISPQYMQRGEFVERFRREARAAGRLRHPNVVNVTDFGFADAADGRAGSAVPRTGATARYRPGRAG